MSLTHKYTHHLPPRVSIDLLAPPLAERLRINASASSTVSKRGNVTPVAFSYISAILEAVVLPT